MLQRLLAYVADERVTHWADLGVGLAQLQVFGRELAEKNALAIYQSARAATLDEKALSVLRGWAGIEEDSGAGPRGPRSLRGAH